MGVPIAKIVSFIGDRHKYEFIDKKSCDSNNDTRKAVYYRYHNIVLIILFAIAIRVALIAVLQSIPSFREQGIAFKFIVFVLVIIATPIAIIAVPIAKIVSKIKAHKAPKAPKNNTQPHSKLTADDIVYCSECGASYIKGNVPDECTECGNKLK